MIKNPRNLYLAGAVAVSLISCVLLWRGYEAFELMEAKAVVQDREVKSINLYASRHAALQSAQKRFDQSFPAGRQLDDWSDYFARIDFEASGLEVDIDRLSLGLSEPPGNATTSLGLHRACVGSGQGADLVVSAKSYSALLAGLEKMLSRPEIQADGVTIYGSRPRPEARLSGFCMLFRK